MREASIVDLKWVSNRPRLNARVPKSFTVARYYHNLLAISAAHLSVVTQAINKVHAICNSTIRSNKIRRLRVR